MEQCGVCGRRFAASRIAAHQRVCKKVANKQRKVFDMTKARVQGTDAAKFVQQPKRGGKSKAAPSTSKATAAADKPIGGKQSKWRREHEAFIANIRAARQYTQAKESGGPLPPPPKSTYQESSDMVSCPHCGRTFNEKAADRHIPICLKLQKKKGPGGGTRRR